MSSNGAFRVRTFSMTAVLISTIALTQITSSEPPSDYRSLHFLGTVDSVKEAAFSPDGSVLYTSTIPVGANTAHVLSTWDSGTLKNLDATVCDNGVRYGNLLEPALDPNPLGQVSKLTVNHHGLLATDGPCGSVSYFGNTGLYLWSSGHPPRPTSGFSNQFEFVYYTDIEFTPDGGNLLVSGIYNTPSFDTLPFIEMWKVSESGGQWISGHMLHSDPKEIYNEVDITVSQDGSMFAASVLTEPADASRILIWDRQNDWAMHELPYRGARDIAFLPDGRTLAAATGSASVELVDLSTQEVVRTLRTPLECPQNPIRELAVSPDGQAIVATSYATPIFVWSPEDKDVLSMLGGSCADPPDDFGFHAVTFSRDGTLLAGSALLETYVWERK